MSVFLWSKEYNTNITEIDDQHKNLVKVMNSLYKGLNSKKNVDLEDILFNLIKYIIMHFSTEEEIMIKYNYTDLVDHIKQHKDFETKIIEFNNQLQKEEANFSIELLDYLKNWLINHILITDKKMSIEINSKII